MLVKIIKSVDELEEFLKQFDTVITPQFEREDGIEPVIPSSDKDWFDRLKLLPDENLTQIGCRQWTEDHWLYPGEWYSFIPTGYEVVDINDQVEAFIPGTTDDDIRFGCLAYGFKKG